VVDIPELAVDDTRAVADVGVGIDWLVGLAGMIVAEGIGGS
jgi:hypothetical protein